LPDHNEPDPTLKGALVAVKRFELIAAGTFSAGGETNLG
jgi:hypothetical protein